jgi:hypothetical protein
MVVKYHEPVRSALVCTSEDKNPGKRLSYLQCDLSLGDEAVAASRLRVDVARSLLGKRRAGNKVERPRSRER